MTYAYPIRICTLCCALVLGASAHAQRGSRGGGGGWSRGGMLGGMLGSGEPQRGSGGGRGEPGGGSGSGGMHGGGPVAEFTGDRGHSPVNNPSPLRNGPQLGLPGRWWDDGSIARRLSLNTDQQRKMDDIFNLNRPQLLTALSNLQREEHTLSSMSSHDLQDQSRVYTAIDRVAAARAELEKQSAHILMLIRQQLDQGQLNALDREIASAR